MFLFRHTWILWTQWICIDNLIDITKLEMSLRRFSPIPWHLWCYRGEGTNKGGSQFNVGVAMTHRQFGLYYSPQVVIRCGQVGTVCSPWYWQRWLPYHNQCTGLEKFCWAIHTQSVAVLGNSFPNHCWNGVITWSITIFMLSFYAPKHSLPKDSQCNNCLYVRL